MNGKRNFMSKIMTLNAFIYGAMPYSVSDTNLLEYTEALSLDGIVSGTLKHPLVTTNGCFDIIHAGHVACLEKAATFGEHMLVLVNSDDSVTRLKGFGRPFVELQHRMMVLAALESVNYVVPFGEDTPEKALETLYKYGVGPLVHVKGGDYVVPEPFPAALTSVFEEDIKKHYSGFPEAAVVHEYGGDVKVIPFEYKTSTSDIVNRIRTHEKNYHSHLLSRDVSLADTFKKE